MSDRRLALMDHADRVGKLLVISGSDFLHSGFSVEAHSDSFVGLNELVKFFRQLLILHSDDTDVVVEGVDLNLKIGVVVKEG